VTELALPFLYALVLWWASTGLILYWVGVPERATRWSGLLAGGLVLAGLAAVWLSSADGGRGGAYIAFTAAVLVWGGVELTFLAGLITGPRRTSCPDGAGGWRRAAFATETVIHHELALAGAGLLVLAAAAGGANPIGPWTYAALWAMRLSAKLNLFLGVPVTNEAMLPDQLRYLASYFRTRPLNLLFPLSVTAGTALAAALAVAATAAGTPPGLAAGLTLVATFLALAVLEHWFMVLPLPSAALWRWSLQRRAPTAFPGLKAELLTLVQPDPGPSLDRRRP
jgi:putative photosynthetic complex assembly protein 2